MRGRTAGIILMLLSSLLIYLPQAHASAPVFVQAKGGVSAVAVSQTLVMAAVTANNVLIGAVFCQDTTNSATTTFSDTRGNVWTQANVTNGFAQQNGGGTQITRINVWTATAKDSGADSITGGCTISQTVAAYGFEFSGVSTANLKSEKSGDTTGTSFSTNTAGGGAASFSGDTVLLSMLFCSSCPTLTPGTGFTRSCPDFCGQFESQYAVSGVASPTFFPATGPNSYWADFGIAIFGQITTTVVTPCTFTQIQCWWYPMFFYGAFASGFLLVGRAGSVNGREMTYLLLAGLTFCSMIQVQMNMTNIMMPMILSITGIVYAVRGR